MSGDGGGSVRFETGRLRFDHTTSCIDCCGVPMAIAIMAFARSASISMLIAAEVFPHEPKVLVMITVMTTLWIVLAVVAVAGFRRSAA
jgi:hypothetical protein